MNALAARSVGRPVVRAASRAGLYLVLGILALVMIYPYIWSLTASFKVDRQIYNGNPLDLVPRPFTVQNYADAWTMVPFGRFLLNSLFLSVVVPALSICVSSLAAYSFARLRFRGRDVVFLALLGVMMMPGHITLIPNYALMRHLRWVNTYLALIIPPVFGAGTVFNTFFMRQFFLSIPKELEDAATIDGCSILGTFLRIILPNSKPALAAVAIIAFKNEWNAFLWPLVVINSFKMMPIQVGLSYFQGNVHTSWGTLLAGTTLAIAPLVVVFLFFQRYFVSSMLMSGLAGK